MNELHTQLLNYSYEHKLSHIPSALSMADYITVLFTNGHVTPNDFIVLGKPFGAQAYYLLWQSLGFMDDISLPDLSVGVKHSEIPFVDFSEETLGNALGVAAGIAMTTDKRVWVNISDAALQMGPTLEALQFIGHNQIKNILVTVDYNGKQVTGNTRQILDVDPVITMCEEYKWHTEYIARGHDHFHLGLAFNRISNEHPTIIFCSTRKGYPFPSMMNDTKTWHYKKIETSDQRDALLNEINIK